MAGQIRKRNSASYNLCESHTMQRGDEGPPLQAAPVDIPPMRTVSRAKLACGHSAGRGPGV
jgi:hypothetical protein